MLCSDLPLLKGVKSRLMMMGSTTSSSNNNNNNNNTRQATSLHVDVAISSHEDQPMPLFRTVEEFRKACPPLPAYSQVEKLRELDVLSIANCHNGQKKLTMSLLEFLTVSLAHLKCEQRDVLVVYAGASGLASVVAANVFKDITFVLYDPAPNTVALLPPFEDKVVYRDPLGPDQLPDMSRRMVIFTSRAGWFDDQTARLARRLLATVRRKHLLFISDIRVKPTESAIVNDMLNQERWALLTGSSTYMFKFRIPYEWGDHVVKAYRNMDLLVETGETVVPATRTTSSNNTNKTGGRRVFPYLDGDLYIQLYGRPKTAELRLIGKRRADGTYGIREFCVNEIEDALIMFNAVYRSHVRFAFGNSASFLVNEENRSYEDVAEYAVVARCCRLLGSRTLAAQKEMQVEIANTIAKFVAKDVYTCTFKTAEKQLHDDPRLRSNPEVTGFLRNCSQHIYKNYPGQLPRDLVDRVIRQHAEKKPRQNKGKTNTASKD